MVRKFESISELFVSCRNIKDKDGQTAYDIAKRLAVLEPLAIGALDPNAQAMPKV